jgi:cyclophilin family peptidyl-prolyl cis-trans isomerase
MQVSSYSISSNLLTAGRLFSTFTMRSLLALLSLVLVFSVRDTHATTVRLETTQGNIEIELFDNDAPRTVANFLSYVNKGAYNNTFIHRSVPGFVIQGGGYTFTDAAGVGNVSRDPAIVNEFSRSRSNVRGTIAMAKIGGDPNSATSEWFINLADNSTVLDNDNGGYTVFGRVKAESMAVVDAIAALRLVNAGGAFAELPVVNYTSGNITRGNLVMVDKAAPTVVTPPLPTNVQGLWWVPEESGWGMSLSQQRNVVFGALFTYDTTGAPIWYVLPGCTLTFTTTTNCTSDIYRVTGGTQPTLPWNRPTINATVVGNGTIAFAIDNTARFEFTIDGVRNTKNIRPQPIANGTTPPPLNYSALWWGGEAESGWGISLTQQFSTIFATWFTYDAARNPVWYVASNCALVEATCTGTLYQVKGGKPITGAWAGAATNVTAVGNIRIAFMGPGAAEMSYTINNVTASRSITRQPF